MEPDRTNTGALFRNRDKETEKHPDYTGKLNVNGVEMKLSAWINESQKGQKFLRVKVSESKPAPKVEKKPEATFDDLEDDIPF